MCGIAGFVLCDKDHGEIDTLALSISLLKGIQSRGRDATGAAWYEGDTLIVQKDAMKASDFVNFLEMPTDARNVILHTRARTQGTERNNDNNHPVITGNIVGVHNGGVWNDDQLFTRMGITDQRIGEVDTEAIFAAIAYGMEVRPGTDKPRLASTLDDILATIDGTAAIAWQEIEGDPNVMHVARIYSSPLYWGQTPNGSFLFASTKDHLLDACKDNKVDLDYHASLDEGMYLRVRSGTVEEFRSFEVQPRTSGKWSKYGGSTTVIGGSKSGTSTTTTHKPLGEKVDALAAGNDDVKKNIEIARAAVKAYNEESKQEAADAKFSPFLNPVALSAHIGLALREDAFDRIDGAEYHELYGTREDSIEGYMEAMKGSADSVLQTCTEFGAFLRPGDWVMTDLSDKGGLYGQVFLLPSNFPYGKYILRVLIPNNRYQSGYEPILVERQFNEFVIMTPEIWDQVDDDNAEWCDAGTGDFEAETKEIEAEEAALAEAQAEWDAIHVSVDDLADADADGQPIGEGFGILALAEYLANNTIDGSNF